MLLLLFVGANAAWVGGWMSLTVTSATTMSLTVTGASMVLEVSIG